MKIVGAFSRKEIEDTIDPRPGIPAVLISIISPDAESIEPYGEYDDILEIRFHDVLKENGKHQLMAIEQAVKIITFALRNVNKDIFVHCEAGMSRSPGVVVALEEIFNKNIDVKDYPEYRFYNKDVYKKINDAWNYCLWFDKYSNLRNISEKETI